MKRALIGPQSFTQVCCTLRASLTVAPAIMESTACAVRVKLGDIRDQWHLFLDTGPGAFIRATR